jgi:hypothetical protein
LCESKSVQDLFVFVCLYLYCLFSVDLGDMHMQNRFYCTMLKKMKVLASTKICVADWYPIIKKRGRDGIPFILFSLAPCCLFVWKQICAGFVCFCLFISVLSFEIQLSEGKVWIPLSHPLPHFYVCSRPGPGCQIPLWCVFFCVKKFNQYQQNEKNTSPQIIEKNNQKRPCNIGMEIQVLV